MLLKKLKDIPQFIAGDKTILREVLHPKNDAIEMNYSIAHAVVLVGEKSLPHILRGRTEVYYILSGRGEMHINDETQIMEKGDTVFIPAGANQWIENVGEVELAFLAMVSPPCADNFLKTKWKLD